MNRIARQLSLIAEQIVKNEQKKQQGSIKMLFKKIKSMLSIKTFYWHRIKDKIVSMVENVIDLCQDNEFITYQQANQLRSRLTGKSSSSLRVSGKRSGIFVLIIMLIKLFSPLLVYCNIVSEEKEKDIVSILSSNIQCTTVDQNEVKDDFTKKYQDFERNDDVYTQEEKQGTEVYSFLCNFTQDGKRFQHFFQFRVKNGQIVKPSKMSDSDFNKMKIIIGLFDEDNMFNLRGNFSKQLQQFIKFNKSMLNERYSQVTISKVDKKGGYHIKHKSNLIDKQVIQDK